MPQIYDKDQRSTMVQEARLADEQAALSNDWLVASAQRTLTNAQARLERAQTLRDNLHLDPRYMTWNLNQRAAAGDQAYAAVATAQGELDTAHNALDVAMRDYHKRVASEKTAAQEAEAAKKFEAEQKIRAEREEAAAKVAFKVSYLESGGTSEQFEAAWSGPTGMWAEELRKRTERAVAIKHNLMPTNYRQSV